jgi:G3E family GTPase
MASDTDDKLSRQRLKPEDRVVVVAGFLKRGKTGVIRDIRAAGPGQSQAMVAWDEGGIGVIMTNHLAREATPRNK